MRISVMKFSRSYITAFASITLIISWFLFNSFKSQNIEFQPTETIKTEQIPTVLVKNSYASNHEVNYKIFGRTEANRVVTLKAETSGLVINTPSKEGQILDTGQIVCRLQTDARKAKLDQAKALLELRRFDLKTTETLVAKGFKSKIQLKSQMAEVDVATANVKQSQIELGNVNIRNQFNGILLKQIAEIGDYLLPGQSCATVIELNPLIVVVELTEQQVEKVQLDQNAEIELLSGNTLTGMISYIEPVSNPATRTFRTEIEVDNSDYKFRGGLTASVSIKSEIVKAHLIPSKILTLNTSGEISVRYVNTDNSVGLSVVNQIDEEPNGIWVTGLPDEALIIIDGQDYVSVGSIVEPKFTNSKNI